MVDVFASMRRPDEAQAQQLAEALRAQGYEVWRERSRSRCNPRSRSIQKDDRKGKTAGWRKLAAVPPATLRALSLVPPKRWRAACPREP